MHAMKVWRGCRGIAPFVCNLGTRWKWLVTPMPGHFTPRERSPGIHWIGGCAGPFASLFFSKNRKIFSHYDEWIPNGPASSLVTILLFYLGRSVYVPDSTAFFLYAPVTVNLLGLCLWYVFKMTRVVAISITWFGYGEPVFWKLSLSPSWSKIWRYLFGQIILELISSCMFVVSVLWLCWM